MPDDLHTSETPLDGEFVINILAGAMRGMELPLRKPSFTLGRSHEADFKINDTLISRIHCHFSYDHGHWYVQDLNSTNGTWLEGISIKEKVLLPLDTSVRIGKTILEIYNLNSADAADEVADNPASFVMEMCPETFGLVSNLTDEAELRSGSETAEIFKFQKSITGMLDEEKLAEKVLRNLSEYVRFDSAAILRFDVQNGAFLPIKGRTVEGIVSGDAVLHMVSRDIIEYVQKNKNAVLAVEKSSDNEMAAGLATVSSSVICAPMVRDKQINCILYVALAGVGENLSQQDLRLVTMIAQIADMAFEHTAFHAESSLCRLPVPRGEKVRELNHYIKNVVAGMEGSLKLIKMGIDKSNMGLISDAWDILDGNYDRIGLLASDLVDFIGEREPEASLVDLKQVLGAIYDVYSKRIENRNIEIENTSGAEGIPYYVEVDQKMIRRALINILCYGEKSIICKCSEDMIPVRGKISISVGFSSNKKNIELVFEDSGREIDTEFQDHYFNVNNAPEGEVSTFLGLTVCKKIVERHNGIITVGNSKLGGARFVISFPMTMNEMSTTTMAIKRIF